MSVNLSGRQIGQCDLILQIDRILRQSDLDGIDLVLEITESALIENMNAVSKILPYFKDRRIKLALDDFGMGFSSLSYLQRLPVDILKIDRSFIQHLGIAGRDSKIVRSIVDLGLELGLEIIAEGVENECQVQKLRLFKCPSAQGFYFSRPADVLSATKLITSAPILTSVVKMSEHGPHLHNLDSLKECKTSANGRLQS